MSFECLDVPVTHWQHLVKKSISIFDGAKFIDFCRKLRTSFSDEITTKTFDVYVLPHGFQSIEQKVKICDDSDFLRCLQHFKDPSDFAPELYVWNNED